MTLESYGLRKNCLSTDHAKMLFKILVFTVNVEIGFEQNAIILAIFVLVIQSISVKRLWNTVLENPMEYVKQTVLVIFAILLDANV